MEYRDYYATLGVPRNASQADIKRAYRKLARQHHPDVNKGDTAAERRFKEVNEAHAVLGDSEKRKAYDQLGANWAMYQRAGAGTGRAGDPFAGFRGFSGGGAAPGGVRFEYHGDPEDLAGFSEFFRTFFAGGASPFGADDATPVGRTTRGRVRVGALDDLFGDLAASEAAENGRRRQPPRTETETEVTLEEVASGTKRLMELDGRRIEVTVPPGVEDGQRIRFSAVGVDGSDVYLRVKVKPHREFSRKGSDLERELPLTLAEALLGTEVPVKTLSGRVLLRIPPETQNGRSFRLAGQGLPRFRGDGLGDLYVRTRVVLPANLDERGRELARQFADHVRQPDPRRSRTGK
jgi:curved DNA-binding protein